MTGKRSPAPPGAGGFCLGSRFRAPCHLTGSSSRGACRARPGACPESPSSLPSARTNPGSSSPDGTESATGSRPRPGVAQPRCTGGHVKAICDACLRQPTGVRRRRCPDGPGFPAGTGGFRGKGVRTTPRRTDHLQLSRRGSPPSAYRPRRELHGGGHVHVEDVTAWLPGAGVDKAGVAIRTADRNDLNRPENQDLMSPKNRMCAVGTKRAPYEGRHWPFADVLCALAASSNPNAVTQAGGPCTLPTGRDEDRHRGTRRMSHHHAPRGNGCRDGSNLGSMNRGRSGDHRWERARDPTSWVAGNVAHLRAAARRPPARLASARPASHTGGHGETRETTSRRRVFLAR